MPAQVPLTHHQILALAAPFTRQGCQVDLAASDRLQRRLLFKPTAAAPGLRQTLQLEPADASPDATAAHRLTRLLDDAASGLQAHLSASGADPAALLAAINAVPPRRQFDHGDGFTLALRQRLDSTSTAAAPAAAPAAASTAAPAAAPTLTPTVKPSTAAALVLTAAHARTDHAHGGVTLTLELPAARRVPAALTVQAAPGDTLALPEDLLAVLGWSWSRLSPLHGSPGKGWRASLQVRGRGAARSHDAEHKLRRTAAHLAQTLAEPPARFHQRHLAGRWAMSLRRGIPLLACLVLFAAAVIVPQLALGQESVLRMLVFNAPPLLLGLFFGLREMPRFEIPPLPRRPRAGSWHLPAVPNTVSER